MRQSLIFIFSLFLSSIVFAQTGNISGVVKDHKGIPVSGATIVIKELNKMTATDDNGKYEIKSVKYGSYILSISSILVHPKHLHIKIDAASTIYNTSVKTIEDKELKQVTIVAKSEKREIETKGFAVNVIETEKAALQSIQTNELLDRSAGVRIRQDGGLGSHIHYSINGLTGNAVRIFIDGVPASNYGSAFSLNSIPPALIERIEVYKGIVPAYLSDDALGGAINVVLKQKTQNSLITSYSIGSFNTHQWNLASNYRNEKGLTFDASAFYNYSDNNYEVKGEEITFKVYNEVSKLNQKAKRFHDAYKSYGARANFGYTGVKWADKFLIGGILSEDYNELQHGSTMLKPYGDRHTRGNTNVATLTYQKNNLFVDKLDLKVDASYSYLKRQVIDTVGIQYDWTGEPLRDSNGDFIKYSSGAELGSAKTLGINSDKTFVTRINLGYAINENHAFCGNYLFNNFKRGVSDELQPLGLQLLENTRDLQKQVLSFTYENIAFANKLRTNIFYKHYFQKNTSNEPYQITANPAKYGLKVIEDNKDLAGYGLTLAYAVSPKLFILGSAEKAVRFPNADEIFGNIANNLLAPATPIQPEKSDNANIGLNLGPYVFNKHSVKLNTSVFYRNTKGLIRERLLSNNNENTQYENLEDVETKGIDAELIYNYVEKIIFNFNISKIDALFNTEFNSRGERYDFYRMQLRNEPSFKFNSNVSYYYKNLFLKKSKGSVYYNINYVGEFLRNWGNIGRTNLDYIPTQFSNDIGFSYTLPSSKLTFSFDAKNIFNEQIFDNFRLQKQGRAFYTKITYAIFK